MKAFRLFYLVIVLCAGSVMAADNKPPQAAIATAHEDATRIGLDILRAGGNAFDAAVAVAAALAVVEPHGSGLGGGAFWLLHDAASGRSVMLDAREAAPAQASEKMYLDRNGRVVREWATNGPLSAAIPGQPAALAHVAEHYGKLPLSVSLQPAIELAEQGFVTGNTYRRMATARASVMQNYAASSDLFLHRGAAPLPGYRVQQPDLANTLRLIAEHGKDGFYGGEFAGKLIEEIQMAGGIWTLDDLANYKVIEREPIVGEFRGARIVTAAPPSSGGIVLMQTLNQIAAFEQKAIAQEMELDDADRAHLTIEAMRRAYYDRARYLGDPDFVEMPVAQLLSAEYATQLADTIQLDKATPSSRLGMLLDTHSGPHTTHFSVIDTEGNRVAVTASINLPFGSGYTVPGTGVLLNNEMDDFSAKPGEANAYGLIGSTANAIAPGKRPLSSMTPTFIEFEDGVAILGTPGGSRIISMVLLATLDVLAGHNPDSWVRVPRYHHQYLPDVVQVEPLLFGDVLAVELRRRGHKVQSTGRDYGNMQAILWNSSEGWVKAASDPRGEGKARRLTN